MAITMETVKRVFRALQDNPGLSVRQIALKLSLSRGTVNMILDGKSRVQRKGERPLANKHDKDVKQVDPYRCRGCGKLVTYMPCVFCKVKSHESVTSSLLGDLLRDSVSRWDHATGDALRKARDDGDAG